LRFVELPPELRPNSDAAGNTRSDAAINGSHELIASVIDRWRSATMGYRATNEDQFEAGAPTLQPGITPSPASSLQRQR
jgi:uncharacterized protein